MNGSIGMTDMHTHFVYGVDDGAQTREEMEAMLDDAHRNGITTLYATSHCTPGMRAFPEERYHAHLKEAAEYCREKDYPIVLHAGAELLYTPAMRNYIERRPLRTLGNSNYVLLEFVPDVDFRELADAVQITEDNGYIPIIAHIERYKCMFSGSHPYRLKDEHNVLLQVNCGTLLKGMGLLKTPVIKKWFRDELIDCVASDMHNCDGRRNRMREGWELLQKTCRAAYLQRLTGWRP